MRIPGVFIMIFAGLFLMSGCAQEENQEIKIINPSVPIEFSLTTKEVEKASLSLSSCAEERKCDDGFFCYDSQYSGMGPNGIVMGPQEGDLLCHQICTSDNECSSGECREIDIFGGDLVEKKSFCY